MRGQKGPTPKIKKNIFYEKCNITKPTLPSIIADKLK
jgi:hypothetical protein